jgi:hypothetical protein
MRVRQGRGGDGMHDVADAEVFIFACATVDKMIYGERGEWFAEFAKRGTE